MDRAAQLLDAYAYDVVQLEARIEELEAGRDSYRELAIVSLARLRRLTEIIRTQRRCLNDRTREYDLAVCAELVAIDRWLEEQLGRSDDTGEVAA